MERPRTTFDFGPEPRKVSHDPARRERHPLRNVAIKGGIALVLAAGAYAAANYIQYGAIIPTVISR